MSEVLGCFLKHQDGAYKYQLLHQDNSNPNITIQTYLLTSQKWPLGNYSDIPTTNWQHRLILYIPREIAFTKALLFVTGGCNRNIEGIKEFQTSVEQMDYARIANNNRAVVAELRDVPNQYLFFNGEPYREDRLVLYSYKKFMEDPLANAYLAGHLPMAKAVTKAMDATQEILKKEYNTTVRGFVLSGASKRGWAVWLAALGDNRVEAIVPIVINVLNVQKSLTYICQSYGGICPFVFKDYIEYGINQNINTENFAKLMAVEDPYSYLNDKEYQERLAIPKYIINAANDDFFVPDSSKWYFQKLPGNKNYIRYLPNSMHYLKGNFISDTTNNLELVNEALDTYFYFFLNKAFLPQINWKFNDDKIAISSSLAPVLVKLWVANNEEARDFRMLTFNPHNSPWRSFIKKFLSYFTNNIYDNYYTETNLSVACQGKINCNFEVPLPPCKKGWQAAFVELHYNLNHHEFVATTEIEIRPDSLPQTKAGDDKDL